jgi:anthranilate synthase/aminodeoxychorismate synthase-like glutamine amidotransferase
MTTLLVIDNYDSFTFNLVQMFMNYDLCIQVHRSDRIGLDQVRAARPDYILISPGPKDPAHAGISKALIESFYRTIPILGVCLGMQCLNEVFGGRTVRAKAPMHGKTSRIYHRQETLFQHLPSPFRVARYHSLAVSPSPEAIARDLIVTASAADGTIMGLSHRRYPLHGVQFHPESFLTQHGFRLVENFLREGPLKSILAADARPRVGDSFRPMETGADRILEARA